MYRICYLDCPDNVIISHNICTNVHVRLSIAYAKISTGFLRFLE